jgi:hypothetical protein
VQGLDSATAPSAAMAKKMLDAIGGRWWNVYIGGPSSSGEGWSPQLISDYVSHGIDRFMLTYCGRWKKGPFTAAQAQADAKHALQLAAAYGYKGHFPLCIDVEMTLFQSNPSAVTGYVAEWCKAVKAAGARPGLYANPGPLTAMHGKVPADFVWVASWVSQSFGHHPEPRLCPGLSKSMWPAVGQRAWQYAGEPHGKCQVLGMSVDIDVADLDCLAGPPGSQIGKLPAHSATSDLIRRGDRGPAVVRLTRRLSYVRSHKTGKPYLDGARKRFDAEAVKALKRYQAEHHLDHDGVFGTDTARALNRSVRIEKAKRAAKRHGGTVTPVTHTTPTNGKPRPKTNLPALVNDVRRLEAETDHAWDALVTYGRRRKNALKEARDRAIDLADIARILLRIEHELEGLVEFEEHGGAAQAPAPAPTAVATPAVATTAAPAAAPVAPAHGNGDAPATAKPPLKLEDLSDAELLQRIDRLEHAVERSREVMIGRYIAVEKEIAKLTHSHPPVVPTPTGGGGTHVKPKPKPTPVPTPTPAPGKADVKKLQAVLNKFTAKYLTNVPPLVVDGKKATKTKRRIRQVRYYLGYGKTGMRSTAVDAKLLQRMAHVGSPRFFNPAMLTRSRTRRRKQHKLAKSSTVAQNGVMMFGNEPVAAWIHPYLVWARAHGWQGTVYSGYRTPEHSEELCMSKCGKPSCPGTCAGRTSHHSGKIKPMGAVDVSMHEVFGPLMQKCPYEPKLWNNLPSDRNHFSAQGN